MIELSNSVKQRFVKDFKLPINLVQDPYFDYFMDMYSEEYKTYQKLELLNNLLAKCETQEDFFQKGTVLSEKIKDFIKNTKAYAEFNSCDLTKFPQNKNLSQQNIYIVPNIDKDLISIDLEKANFNCFRLFGLQEETGVKTYNQLINLFSNDEYFAESKMFRQVIFGDLNPARQQKIQRYIIGQLCNKLLENGCEISSASSDEIIIKNKTNTVEIKDILKDVPEEFKFFRVEKFRFSRIGEEHDFFIKETIQADGTPKLEFKNVPGHLFPQVFKQYKNMPLNDYDMMFYHDGYLAQFKEPVFQNTLTNTSTKKAKP